MNNIVSFFAALLVLVAANVGWGQHSWEQTNGPFSITAECFTTIGTNLFVGTDEMCVHVPW